MGFLKTTVLVLLVSVILTQVPDWIRRKPLPRHGHAAPQWKHVIHAFRELVDSGAERGGSLAVYYKNKLVVELYGGYADEESEIPVDNSTLFQIFSTTKGVAGVVMAIMVQRGLLEYAKPIANYWPEFAQNGKSKITIEHLLTHQAGLAVVDDPFSFYDDLDIIGNVLAKSKPEWSPGTKHGYHALTIGLLEDQVMRRVDPKKRTISQFFDEEIAKPYGLDFYIGLPLAENHRCARIQAPSLLGVLRLPSSWELYFNMLFNKDDVLRRILETQKGYDPINLCNKPKMRATINPAAQGFTTAKHLAAFYNAVLYGANGKHPLLSKESVKLLNQPVISGKDHVMYWNITYGRGTTLYETPLGGYMFGTPGAGGQMGYADPARDLTWAYVTNYHQVLSHPLEHPSYGKLQKAIYDSVKEIKS